MDSGLDLVQLRYFRAIAHAGSLTSAARQLRVSQPTLSVAIGKLERTLATSLLDRGRAGVTLTTTGRELLARSEEILGSVARAEQAIRGLESDEVGRFVVACPDALGAYFLPALVERLYREVPRLELSLWNGTSREVERAILERTAQFGLVARRYPYPELVGVDLFHDRTELFVLGPPPRGLARAKQRLRGGPLLYVEHLPQEPEILRELAQSGLLPDRRLVCGTLELVKSMALAGLGVGILPSRVARYGYPDALQLLHSSFPAVEDVISLVYRSDLHRTKAALRLKSELIAHGKAFGATGPTGGPTKPHR
jgi:DNA-binding transcriptional LysR family regulator